MKQSISRLPPSRPVLRSSLATEGGSPLRRAKEGHSPDRDSPRRSAPAEPGAHRDGVGSSIRILGRRWAEGLKGGGKAASLRTGLMKDWLGRKIQRESVTGLWMRRQVLEWTTLREGKNGIETLASRRVMLEADDAVLTDPEKLASEIRRQCPDLSGPVSLGLPSDQMLLRVVELPSADPDEMNSMIKLQMDKFSPFPEERMAVSFESLQTAESGCRVLIVAIQKDVIEFTGRLFQKAGIELRRIDADVLVWWRLLSDQGAAPATGRHILLLLEADGGILMAVQQGVPVSFKTVGSNAGLSAEEYASEMAHELGSFILALDLEQGVAPVAGLDFWYRDLEPEALADRLKTEFGQEIRLQRLDSLPALSEGLARRMLSPPFTASLSRPPGVRPVLDLVPVTWRVTETSLRVKQRLIAASGLVLGIWLLAALSFLGGYALEKHRLKKLERRMVELQKPAEDVRTMQRRARSFEQYLDRKRSALECLREISQLLPADVSITAFQFKKGKSIAVRGEALTVNPIYDFKQALDKSPLFKKIEMGSTQPSKRKEATVQTFQMTIHLPEEQP